MAEQPNGKQAEQGDVLPECPVGELVALYESRRPQIKLWMAFVRDALSEVMPPEVRCHVHSVSGRLKDPDHLREKIARKRTEGREITTEGFFDVITDLGGVRVLTLYRWDLRPIHEFIASAACWYVREGPIVYAGSEDDDARLRELKFAPESRRPGKRYTSIHYVVSPGDKAEPWMRCEIQLRGLHTEGWGEVDHQLRYPNKYPGPFAENVLRTLQSATVVTDWLAEFARMAANYHEREHALAAAMDQLSSANVLWMQKVEALEAKVSELQKQLEAARSKGQPVQAEVLVPVIYEMGEFLKRSHVLNIEPTKLVFESPLAALAKLGETETKNTCDQCEKPFFTSLSRSYCSVCRRCLCQDCFDKGRRYDLSNMCANCQTNQE